MERSGKEGRKWVIYVKEELLATQLWKNEWSILFCPSQGLLWHGSYKIVFFFLSLKVARDEVAVLRLRNEEIVQVVLQLMLNNRSGLVWIYQLPCCKIFQRCWTTFPIILCQYAHWS